MSLENNEAIYGNSAEAMGTMKGLRETSRLKFEELKQRLESGDKLTDPEKDELRSFAQSTMTDEKEREAYIRRIYGLE